MQSTAIIFLTKTADEDVYKMTASAVGSLKETSNDVYTIIVESQSDCKYKYDCDLTLTLDGEFNYNKALNLAFQHTSDFELVGCFNNDVLFLPNWYDQILNYMRWFNLDSVSPWCPMNQNGVNPADQQNILSYRPSSVYFGFDTIRHFAGWGWIMKNEVLKKMLPLPEELKFWFQDNQMALELKKMGKIHGCVTSSQVIHFGQSSYRLIPLEKKHGMTMGLYETFIKKWMN